ncbi:MAG: hypothetical protein AUI14_01050 [Actinobacteria bacterium 13_2_20CM_2_71_6]|nr:MAG: hypothetical protein AUI14_01050 [Actinobacteria bacterium 13_2_20CM_2_71_6]
MLDIPTGDVARDLWWGLTVEERRKILGDGCTGRAQGLPELARIAAGWARTAADASRHRSLGYLAATLVAAAASLAVDGLLPPTTRLLALAWFGVVCLVALLASRVEAQQRQVYAWVEACNLNYLLSLDDQPGPVAPYAVRYRAPSGRYAILPVYALLPIGSGIGTGASPLTLALTILVAGWAATVIGRDLRYRQRPLAVLSHAGVELPHLRLTVPWPEIGWVFVGIRGRRYAVGVHWVLRGPSLAEAVATRADLPTHRRIRLGRRLAADPRFTLNCLLCREPPEHLVLLSAAVQRAAPVRVPS